jgi:ribosomal protein S3
LDCVLFLTSKIKSNKIENVKKFTNVKLYGAKPSIVIAPSRKGAKNITKNLLLSKAIKLKSLLLMN